MALGIGRSQTRPRPSEAGINMEAAGMGRGFRRITHSTPTLEVLNPAANQNLQECL